MNTGFAAILRACILICGAFMLAETPMAEEGAVPGSPKGKPEDQTKPEALKRKPVFPSPGFQFGTIVMSGAYLKPFREAAHGPALVLGTDLLAGMEFAYAHGLFRYTIALAPTGLRVQSDKWVGSAFDPGAYIGHGAFATFQIGRIAVNAGLPDYNWNREWGNRMDWKETSFGVSWVPLRLPWWW